jgi:hypothetical protein
MSHHTATPVSSAQASTFAAHHLSRHLITFLAPLLRTLDQQLDRRLVSTFLAALIAIVEWRNRAHGLLLSQLGAYLLRGEQAPAGTKRLSNLLRSPRWSASLIADSLWQQACAHVHLRCAAGDDPLLVWDLCWCAIPAAVWQAVVTANQRYAQRIGDRVGLHIHPPSCRLAQVEPTHRRNSVVLGSLFLRLVARLGLAVDHVAEIGVQALVGSAEHIRIIQQVLPDLHMQVGLLTYLALHAGLWRLIAFQPGARQQPVAATVAVVIV